MASSSDPTAGRFDDDYQQVLRRRTSAFYDESGQPLPSNRDQQGYSAYLTESTDDRSSSFTFWNLFSPYWYLSIAWNFIHSATFASVFVILLIWASIFIYITFYFLYIPSLDLSKSIYFNFDSSCAGIECSNPKAIIPLTEYRNPTLFAKGQQYRIRVDLTVPDSEVNSQQGMFMVKLTLFDANNKEITTAKRPSMLTYKSFFVRLIHIFFNWPFYIVGFSREDEKLKVSMIEEYVDGTRSRAGPAQIAEVELISRDIQIYDSTLVIQANLTGLRYYMVNWPIITAMFGIATIFAFLSLVTIFSINRVSKEETTETQVLYGDVDNPSTSEESQVYHSVQPGNSGEYQSLPVDSSLDAGSGDISSVSGDDESPDSTTGIE